MPISLKAVDTSKLEANFADWCDLKGQTYEQTLREQGRLLCLSLCKYTQPFGLDKKAELQGKGAIERDFHKVYVTVASDLLLAGLSKRCRPKDVQNFQIRIGGYISSNNVGAITKILRDMKVAHVSEKADISYHTNRFVSGRLRSGVTQIVADTKSVTKLLKQTQALVGYAKAGWYKAALKCDGRVDSFPKWTQKEIGKGDARAVENGDKLALILSNQVNFTSRVLSDSSIKKAVNERADAIRKSIDAITRHSMKKALT